MIKKILKPARLTGTGIYFVLVTSFLSWSLLCLGLRKRNQEISVDFSVHVK
jgi:hypothetical protein